MVMHTADDTVRMAPHPAGETADQVLPAEVAARLQNWLAQAVHDLDPSIVAFIAACAARAQAPVAEAASETSAGT